MGFGVGGWVGKVDTAELVLVLMLGVPPCAGGTGVAVLAKLLQGERLPKVSKDFGQKNAEVIARELVRSRRET